MTESFIEQIDPEIFLPRAMRFTKAVRGLVNKNLKKYRKFIEICSPSIKIKTGYMIQVSRNTFQIDKMDDVDNKEICRVSITIDLTTQDINEDIVGPLVDSCRLLVREFDGYLVHKRSYIDLEGQWANLLFYFGEEAKKRVEEQEQ